MCFRSDESSIAASQLATATVILALTVSKGKGKRLALVAPCPLPPCSCNQSASRLLRTAPTVAQKCDKNSSRSNHVGRIASPVSKGCKLERLCSLALLYSESFFSLHVQSSPCRVRTRYRSPEWLGACLPACLLA